jgi:hypothetical protein
MDAAIWWLHAQLARAAGEYALTHHDHAMADALPALWLVVSYAWLALTLYLGAHRQWLYFQGISPAHAHMEALQREVEAATEPEDRNAPKQDPDDGLWYVPTYDAATGKRAGKRVVEPPKTQSDPTVVTASGQRLALRRS